MISTNSKVNRMLAALAIELRNLPDEKIKRIHDIINDKQDGYKFDFKATCESMRVFVQGD